MTSHASSAATAAAQPIYVPREIVNADDVYVVSWSVPDGSWVEAGAVVCAVETSKAVVDVEVQSAGYLCRRAAVGESVPVGGILGFVSAQPDTPLPEAIKPVRDASEPAVRISAKAKRLIAEMGLDPALFAGRGFVREQDVLEVAAAQPAAATPREDPRGPFRLEPLGVVQRRVARVMEQSVANFPAAFVERTIDFAAVRARAQALMADAKLLVTPVDILVAAVARAAREFPLFNAFLTRDYHTHVFDRVNVGLAIDVEGDLYVAVMRDAADKAIADLAKELHTLQYLALRRRLSMEQLSGGTITVTAMIGNGVHRFQPIPYPEQAAIVCLAAEAADSATATLGLVFDHRIANGSQAAMFLSRISDAMSNAAL